MTITTETRADATALRNAIAEHTGSHPFGHTVERLLTTAAALDAGDLELTSVEVPRRSVGGATRTDWTIALAP